MTRFARLALALSLLAIAPAAMADGLYLKLREGAHPAADGRVTLTLVAVATHNFELPQTPIFLIDDGSGMRVAAELRPRPVDVPETVRVTPDQRFEGSWQLSLAPGSYKMKVRYKLADRTLESNAVKLSVLATAQP